jgi:mono/diheme cytochrome c family protein
MNLIKLFLVVLAVSIFVAACAQPAANTSGENDGKKMAKVTNSAASPATDANANTASAPAKNDVERAAELYTKNCMTCHKDSGKGGKVTVDGKNLDVDDLTTEKKKARSDEKLANDISEGAEDDGMPAFKNKLKPEEIALVVKHLRTLQAK